MSAHAAMYCTAGWNILDGTVVALGYVDVLMSGSSVTALRAVRVLRPLRTITHIKGLRVRAQLLQRQAEYRAASSYAVECSRAIVDHTV